MVKIPPIHTFNHCGLHIGMYANKLCPLSHRVVFFFCLSRNVIPGVKTSSTCVSLVDGYQILLDMFAMWAKWSSLPSDLLGVTPLRSLSSEPSTIRSLNPCSFRPDPLF